MSDLRHGTLVADTVATENLDADYGSIEVLNRGDDPIFFRVDGTAPTVEGADCFVAPAHGGVTVPVESDGNTVVKLISAGTPDYSISAGVPVSRSGFGASTAMGAAVGNTIAARATDLAVTGVAGRLHGFSLGEAAEPPATAKAFIRDGDDAADPVVAVIDLLATESTTVWFGEKGIAIATGVYLDIVSGTIEGSIYTGAA